MADNQKKIIMQYTGQLVIPPERVFHDSEHLKVILKDEEMGTWQVLFMGAKFTAEDHLRAMGGVKSALDG